MEKTTRSPVSYAALFTCAILTLPACAVHKAVEVDSVTLGADGKFRLILEDSRAKDSGGKDSRTQPLLIIPQTILTEDGRTFLRADNDNIRETLATGLDWPIPAGVRIEAFGGVYWLQRAPH